jgi:hypothetical protein
MSWHRGGYSRLPRPRYFTLTFRALLGRVHGASGAVVGFNVQVYLEGLKTSCRTAILLYILHHITSNIYRDGPRKTQYLSISPPSKSPNLLCTTRPQCLSQTPP